jgi:hypothetical protein
MKHSLFENSYCFNSEVQDLLKLEENAKNQKKGMWNPEAKDKKRPMTKESTPTEIFERLKGTAQNGLFMNDIYVLK